MEKKLPLVLLAVSALICSCSPKQGLKEAAAPPVEMAPAANTGFRATLTSYGEPSLLYVSRNSGKFRLEKEGNVYLGSLADLTDVGVENLNVFCPETSSYAIYSQAMADPIRAAKTPSEKRRLQALNGLVRGFSAVQIQLILKEPCRVFSSVVGTHPECQVEDLGGKKRFTHISTMRMKGMLGGSKEVERYMKCDYDTELGIILNSDSNVAGQWKLTEVSAEEPSPALFEVPSGYKNTLNLKAMDQTPGPLTDREGERWKLFSYDVWDVPPPPRESQWLMTEEVATFQSDRIKIVSGYPVGRVDLASPPFKLPKTTSQGGTALEVQAWDSKPLVGEHFSGLDESTAVFTRKGRLVKVEVQGKVTQERLHEVCAEVDELLKKSPTSR
jgi:hypothetical protein